jgi:hypothetical protein
MQSTYYFCALDALDVAQTALADILDHWDEAR